MRKTSSQLETEIKFANEVKNLTKEVKKLHNAELMQVFRHPVKFLTYAFLKGLMIGLGSVLGATVLVALLVYILAQMSLVPVIGDFIEDIIGHIKNSPASESIQTLEKSFVEKYEEEKKMIEEQN